MNAENFRETFERDGYVLIENFFASELMDRLDRMIRDHFGDDPRFLHSDEFLDTAQTDVIPWFPRDDGEQAFNVIEEHDGLSDLTTLILGDGWSSHYCMVMFSKRGTTGQAWHQDCPPDDPARFNLNRLVYTASITNAIGGQIVVVPGSHRRGLLPPGEPLGDLHGQVVLRPEKGALVMIHGHTWHRVLPITGACRYSINYRAAPAGAPADITDVCVYRNMRYRFSTATTIERRVGG